MRKKRMVLIVCVIFVVGIMVTLTTFEPKGVRALEGFPNFQYVDVAINNSGMAYNPTNEFIFPSVIKASDYFSNPLGSYYIYYAPHDTPGEICLAYSNSLDGPWTEYFANPIIKRTWEGIYSVNHVSSPHAIYDDTTGRLFLYYHGDNNTTRLASSSDGINFTYEKVVLTGSNFNDGGPLKQCSYFRVYKHTMPSKGNKYIGLLMGERNNVRKIYLAWSNDGKDWITRPSPLISPISEEGTNLAGPSFFPWNNRYYVVYHGSSGDMRIAEVGEDFEMVNRLGVFYPADADTISGRACEPTFFSQGNIMHMWYTAGPVGSSKIAHAVANLDSSTSTPTPPPTTPTPTPSTTVWDLINDDMDNYTSGWGTSGTSGSVTQNSGYVTIADNVSGSSGSYFYMTKSAFTAPQGSYTFEVRAKANVAGTTNEITIRSSSYMVALYLTYGISGSVQNKAASPTKTFILDTTVYRTYRIVVHSNYTYDLYVDGVLAWSGAPNLGSGSSIFKIGGDNNPLANMDVDYVRMGTGTILP